MAPAAQAKPFEAPTRPVPIQGPAHVHAWAMHAVGNPAARGHARVTVAQDPAAVTSSGGINWTAFAGGAALVVLVGALGTALFRLRPQRPSTA
jgi:hypothetical protein